MPSWIWSWCGGSSRWDLLKHPVIFSCEWWWIGCGKMAIFSFKISWSCLVLGYFWTCSVNFTFQLVCVGRFLVPRGV
jgi:hypothetical protein